MKSNVSISNSLTAGGSATIAGDLNVSNGLLCTNSSSVGVNTCSADRSMAVEGGLRVSTGTPTTATVNVGIVFGGEGIDGTGIFASGGSVFVCASLYFLSSQCGYSTNRHCHPFTFIQSHCGECSGSSIGWEICDCQQQCKSRSLKTTIYVFSPSVKIS